MEALNVLFPFAFGNPKLLVWARRNSPVVNLIVPLESLREMCSPLHDMLPFLGLSYKSICGKKRLSLSFRSCLQLDFLRPSAEFFFPSMCSCGAEFDIQLPPTL